MPKEEDLYMNLMSGQVIRACLVDANKGGGDEFPFGTYAYSIGNLPEKCLISALNGGGIEDVERARRAIRLANERRFSQQGTR